ncbi:MAG: type III polyketide synthase [Planctomycetota bacterium]
MMQIQRIGLATPGPPIPQAGLLELALRHNATNQAERRRLERVYHRSKVGQRHSVLGVAAQDGAEALRRVLSFYQHDHPEGPGTEERMRVYEAHAAELSREACGAALSSCGTDPESITQLITVSCTGFIAPGLDASLIRSLGLSATVGRTHIGFMGCHAALNALRVADAFVRADPEQSVLLCCTELCTLHFQYGSDPQDAVANALFADGAAALVGTSHGSSGSLPYTHAFHAENLPGTRDMMSWRIADHGFQMRLDPGVPQIIESRLKASITAWLAKHGLTVDGIAAWAIHAGGPKIIDAVQNALGLPDEATRLSRLVLAEYGNMSSPTVLYILDALRRNETPPPWVVLGFGPGLAIEAALLR